MCLFKGLLFFSLSPEPDWWLWGKAWAVCVSMTPAVRRESLTNIAMQSKLARASSVTLVHCTDHRKAGQSVRWKALGWPQIRDGMDWAHFRVVNRLTKRNALTAHLWIGFGQLTFNVSDTWLSTPHNGVLRAQKVRTHLLKTQCSNVFLLKPGVDQNTALRDSHSASDFFLDLVSTFPVHSPSFFPKHPPSFSWVGCS